LPQLSYSLGELAFDRQDTSSVKPSSELHENVDCCLPPVLSFWMALRHTREFGEAGLGSADIIREILRGQETKMIEKTDDQDKSQDKSDYSCEILSFVVLVILSALSHFWFIVIGICFAIVVGAAIILLGQFVRTAATALPWLSSLETDELLKRRDSRSQVFLPRKIRQSVD
jgi:Ca2+/Na+ antiporter